MIKKILLALILIPAIGGIGYYIATVEYLDFESVCGRDHKRYTKLCKNVEKRAYSKKSVINITSKDYGLILGVAWRKKGSIISSKIQKKKRYSEGNAYYYILGSDKKGANQFLRLATETDAH